MNWFGNSKKPVPSAAAPRAVAASKGKARPKASNAENDFMSGMMGGEMMGEDELGKLTAPQEVDLGEIDIDSHDLNVDAVFKDSDFDDELAALGFAPEERAPVPAPAPAPAPAPQASRPAPAPGRASAAGPTSAQPQPQPQPPPPPVASRAGGPAPSQAAARSAPQQQPRAKPPPVAAAPPPPPVPAVRPQHQPQPQPGPEPAPEEFDYDGAYDADVAVGELTDEDLNDPDLAQGLRGLGLEDCELPGCVSVPYQGGEVDLQDEFDGEGGGGGAGAAVPAAPQPAAITVETPAGTTPLPPPNTPPYGGYRAAKAVAVALKACPERQAEAILWVKYAKSLLPKAISKEDSGRALGSSGSAGGGAGTAGAAPVARSSSSGNTGDTEAAGASVPLPAIMEAPSGSYAHAKATALRLKEAGRTQEASSWVKFAKLQYVEEQKAALASSGAAIKSALGQQGGSSSAGGGMGVLAAGQVDMYSPLEVALIEACAECLEASKVAGKGDAGDAGGKAKAKLAEFKKHQQDLNALRNRRLALQHQQAQLQPDETLLLPPPPTFHWTTVRVEEEHENRALTADQWALTVHRVTGASDLLGTHKRSSVSVQYNMQVPKDDPVTGSVAAAPAGTDNCIEFNHSATLEMRRGKVLTNALGRRAAVFELFLPGGMFVSRRTLGYATLPLRPLLHQSGIEQVSLPITEESKGSGANKPVGGQLVVSLLARRPYAEGAEGRDIRVHEERRLVVDEASWSQQAQVRKVAAASAEVPPPAAPPSTAPQGVAPSSAPAQITGPPPGGVQDRSQQASKPSPAPSPAPAPTPAPVRAQSPAVSPDAATGAAAKPTRTPTAATAAAKPAGAAPVVIGGVELTDLELRDPLGAQFLESSEVMDFELEQVGEKLKHLGRGPDAGEARMDLEMRRDIVQTRSDILVSKVQNEKITIEEYLDLVRARVKRDQALALYFHKKPASHDDPDPDYNKNVAKQIMRRVKIMQEEIKGAEEAF